MPLTVSLSTGRRRLLAGVAVAAVLVLVPASAAARLPTPAPVGWLAAVALTAVVGAATLATYVPARGQNLRDAIGCAPCAALPAVAVVGALVLLTSAPYDLAMALVALALVLAGLGRRWGATGEACPTS